MPDVPHDAVQSFYRAALLVLRFLEQRSGQRRTFGADANARWRSFAGHLTLGDRIDLAILDASRRQGTATAGAAFSAARVFQLKTLADDEPFGPDWPGLGDDESRRLWAEAEGAEAATWQPVLEQAWSAWGLAPAGAAPDTAGISPATRVLTSGPTALQALAVRYAASETLRWSERVAVLAERPGERHVAGLIAALVGSPGPTRVISPAALARAEAGPARALHELLGAPPDLAILSDDAEPVSRDLATSAMARS